MTCRYRDGRFPAQTDYDPEPRLRAQIIEQIRDLDEEHGVSRARTAQPSWGTPQNTQNRLIVVGRRNILHLFQCLVFCLTHGKPHKWERNRCGYRVEGVSAGQTDCLEQR